MIYKFTTNNINYSLDEDNYKGFNFISNEDESEEQSSFNLYGTNLTYLAQKGKLDECFGREKELRQLMEILIRRQKNNPVLLGKPGVGKTAIIELFAQKIVNNLVPFVLQGRILINIDINKILAGAKFRGEFEQRFQRIINEVLETPNVIVFIDEIHTICSSGSTDGGLDAASILKPILSRSGFQCIGATTQKEYDIIKKDPALDRRFQEIIVEEPTIPETISILYGIRPNLEKHHNLQILPSTIKASVELASRYIQDKFFPDKAIDLLDRAAAQQVLSLTEMNKSSNVYAIVNTAIKKLGELKMASFRNGDMASEFIFYMLESSYKEFLLKWIKNPINSLLKDNESTNCSYLLNENEKSINSNSSPLTLYLIKMIRVSVLKHMESSLFSLPKSKKRYNREISFENISSNKNANTYLYLKDILTLSLADRNENKVNKKQLNISIYRISLFIFNEWLQLNNFSYVKKKKLNYMFYDKNIKNFYQTYSFIKNSFKHLRNLRKISIKYEITYKSKIDFQLEDLDQNLKSLVKEIKAEKGRINIIKNLLNNLTPILSKSIVESLKDNSRIEFTENELNLIYSLIGYFGPIKRNKLINKSQNLELLEVSTDKISFNNLQKNLYPNDIRRLLSNLTGIPLETITNTESERLLNLENILHKRVIGQEEAINAISKAIRRSRLGIQNPNRPIASFFFCGPTGVGKTEVTKVLANTMFGSDNEMIRFDMSEFMEKFNVSRLIGSPPGYTGYEDGGQLTNAVKKKPYSVVLFDEIEKGHPEILNILLQILEDGRLTDSQKNLVSFDNTVIIMTSNAASEEIQEIIRNNPISLTKKKDSINTDFENHLITEPKNTYSQIESFLNSPISENFLIDIHNKLELEFKKSFSKLKKYDIMEKIAYKNLKEKVENSTIMKKSKEDLSEQSELQKLLKNAVIERLSTMFLPEFLNRLDDIIIFQPLKAEELRKICDIMIQSLSNRLNEKNIFLTVSDNVKLKLTREGYNPKFGARPLRRLITKNIEDLISEDILKKPLQKNENKRLIKISLNELNNICIIN